MTLSRKFVNLLFVLLLIATLIVRAPQAGSLEFPETAEDVTPLKSGDRAPAFTVRTTDNDVFSFDPSALRKPVVLISYRGGWCPYCNMHLSELHVVILEIQQMGVDVLFISNDRPDILYSSLKRETQEDIDGLDYTILSDADLNAATAFGTAFIASDGLIAWLERKEKDYEKSSIANHGALAVPAVYVVDTSGTIIFDYVNANYKVRLPADELLAAAQKAANPQ